MADETVKGLNAFTITNQQETWRNESGFGVSITYMGPQALRDAFRQTLIQQGALSVDASTGVPCTIVAVFPLTPSGYNEDQKAQDEAVWELNGETVEKKIESHGKFNYSGSSQEWLEKIEAAIKDGTASDHDWDTESSSLGEFNKYVQLRMMGVDSYESYTYRVRCTKVVSKVSLLKAVYTNVGKIVAWTAIGVPATAKFSQPVIHMVKPLNSGAWSDESVNEWLVQPPSVRWRKGIRKWEITQEWIGTVSASGTLYDGGGQTP
jgi:hypothetical protein